MKIMAIVDRHALPLSVSTHAANHHDAEVLVAGTITQHGIDGCQDRRGNRDCCPLGAVARFETEELGLKIAVLLARCAPRSLHQYGLEQGALFLIRVERRLPALSRRGTNPAHERRRPTVGNGLMSVPISAITVSVAVAPSLGTSLKRSTMS